jgi:hypothetical protein
MRRLTSPISVATFLVIAAFGLSAAGFLCELRGFARETFTCTSTDAREA